MSPETKRSRNIAKKTQAAQLAWDETPTGRKKTAALRHYDEIIRELDAVADVLS